MNLSASSICTADSALGGSTTFTTAKEATYEWFQSLEPIERDPAPLVGNNNIFLNMATMMKAVEWWLNSEVLQGDVTVGAIEYRDYMFCVTITSNGEESNAAHS